MKNGIDLEKELLFLGLLDKAREIHTELGDKAALSYIKCGYRLLSKVYHPDLNPKNIEKAKITQQRLNRVNNIISRMKDEEIIKLITKDGKRSGKKKKKILIVEDEFGLQEIFRDIFLMEGYDVRIAVDGVKGYKIYHQFQPDLLFTDVVMPRMNGLDLVRKIREVNPQIRVIYISGFFGIDRLKRELDEDLMIYGYPTLSKPFKTSEMLDLVKNYLGGY
nr:response regulator [Deltaproteobacteria bacterium]